MNTVPFDTLKMAERLEGAGVPAVQAKVHTEILAEAISAEEASLVERFGDKPAIALEFASVRADIARVHVKIEESAAKIEKLDAKIDKMDAKIDKMDARIDKLDARIDKLDAKIDQRAAELKTQLMLWVGSVGVLQMALIGGLALRLTS